MSSIDNKPFSLSQTVANTMYERDVAAQRLEIKINLVEEGTAELSMTVKKWMIQGHNICHGGYIFLLADTAMAYASNGRNKVNLAMNANIDFAGNNLFFNFLYKETFSTNLVQSVRIMDVSSCFDCLYIKYIFG